MSEPGAIRRLPRPGTIVPFGGDTIPSGWLLCNGAEVSRTEYARLFAAVGTYWGTGDGETTFNVPDGRGRVLQGADDTNSLGVGISAGVPNATGWLDGSTSGGYSVWGSAGSGSLYNNYSSNSIYAYTASITNITRSSSNLINLDLSRSSSLYGESSTVQPPAISTRYMIRC